MLKMEWELKWHFVRVVLQFALFWFVLLCCVFFFCCRCRRHIEEVELKAAAEWDETLSSVRVAVSRFGWRFLCFGVGGGLGRGGIEI